MTDHHYRVREKEEPYLTPGSLSWAKWRGSRRWERQDEKKFWVKRGSSVLDMRSFRVLRDTDGQLSSELLDTGVWSSREIISWRWCFGDYVGVCYLYCTQYRWNHPGGAGGVATQVLSGPSSFFSTSANIYQAPPIGKTVNTCHQAFPTIHASFSWWQRWRMSCPISNLD